METISVTNVTGKKIVRGRRYSEGNAPTITLQTQVAKVNGPAALRMPPMVMAIVARLYGEGGWPVRPVDGGKAWVFDGPLCRGEISEIRDRQARFRLWMRQSSALISDIMMRYEAPTHLSRLMTVDKAVKASGLSADIVRAALRANGVEPDEETRYNAVALRRALIVYCRRQRDAHKGRTAAARTRRAVWEGLQMAVERSGLGRWER